MKDKSFTIDSNYRPFLKWAGGKSQLLEPIMQAIEHVIADSREFVYMEPFVGSGAVFMKVMERHSVNVSQAIINDRNSDLINTYRIIRDDLPGLIEELEKLTMSYNRREALTEKEQMFYSIRDTFNGRNQHAVLHAAHLIFLNKTCYNGLYRVNSLNQFNVPFGRYSNPKIYNPQQLEGLSRMLKDVEILDEDFASLNRYANAKNRLFVYLDPPYRPISKTSSFNAYSRNVFNDREQLRLKNFCDQLHAAGKHWLLSNSDPKNTNPEDTFFEALYADYFIDRVEARRSINSNGAGRGLIRELLISNFRKGG